MSEDPILKHFELEYTGTVDEVVPVYKYRALQSGAHIVVAQVEGPYVKGFICLATEAHDDDGLPMALKNLVGMGNEEYPYKGIMTHLARRCFGSDSIGGWVDNDHTGYYGSTAGSEGFLNLLPIFLNQILYPGLKESAYMTEVHHIDGEGKDAGKMYSMCEGCETMVNYILNIELLREMYPGHCGYKSVTDGITKNLRESTSLQKVKSYYSQFYRPENLCIMVVGMVEPLEVLQTFLKFEEKIQTRPVDWPVYVKPWQSEVPPLSASAERVVKYGSEEEKLGLVSIGWRGPPVTNQEEIVALNVLFEYLRSKNIASFTTAPMRAEFVDQEETICSEICCFVVENSISCLYLRFYDVPLEKLRDIKPRILKFFESLSMSDERIDLDRMLAVIQSNLVDSLCILEDSPYFNIIFNMIKDFLYSEKKEDTDVMLSKVSILRGLSKKPASYWTALIKKYFVDKNHVTIIGEPSADLMKELEESEAKRVTQQKEDLKEEGLAEKQKLLELAIKESEIQPPAELLSSIPVPSVNSIQFRSVKSSCNYTHDSSMSRSEKFPLDDIPISFQLDDIKSKFVVLRAAMDSSGISEELLQYLQLYTEVLRESAIVRDGALITPEDVIKEFASDTVDSELSIGVSNYFFDRRYECGLASMFVVLRLRVEIEEYMKGVQWLHELLYDVQFDVKQLKIAIDRIISDIDALNASGFTIAAVLLAEMSKVKGSNGYVLSMLRQRKFLKEMKEKFEADPNYSTLVIEKLNELKLKLTDPARIRIHMSAHVDRLVTQTGLSDAVSVWSKVFLPLANQKYRSNAACIVGMSSVKTSSQRDYELQKPYTINSGNSSLDNLIDSSMSLIIGIESVGTSTLFQITPCLTEFRHPDVPAIMLYMQYLTSDDGGPLYKQICAAELSYKCILSLELDYGQLKFCLWEATKVVDAYRIAKGIIEEYMRDGIEFDAALIELCKNKLILDCVEDYDNVNEVSRHSLLAYLRGIPHGYTRWLVDRIPEVSTEDMRRVSKLYFSTLFNPTQSKLSICTEPANVDDICQHFKTQFQREITVVKSLDEPYLVNM